MSVTPTLVAGRYRLGAELGRGGMGVVWEAYDELLHRTVAVKEVHFPVGISDDERERLARRTLREARAVAAVEHPHAVRVFDIVEQDGRPWIVMELVRGRTLTEAIRDGALPVAEIARIGAALADALGAAHAAGVLHRDVKPSNVILGANGRVALTDFGIATVDSDPSDVTTSGQIVGSPAYMAPERARGDRPTAAADIWSLGATLWTAAEGRPPYGEGNAFATMAKLVTEEPPACTRCGGALGSVIGELMERDPACRPDAAQARARLEQVAAGAPELPAPYPTEPLPAAFDRTVVLPAAAGPAPAADPAPAPAPAREQRRSRSNAPLLVALAVAVVAAAVAAAFLLSHSSGSSSSNETAGSTSTPRSSPESATPTPAGSSAASRRSPATTGAAALPAGWHRYTSSAIGWSIGVPPGWTTDVRGSSTYFRDPAGGRYLQLDTKYPAGPSAKGAWEDQERAFQGSHADYQRIRLENVDWRSYPDVADWEFTYRSGALTLHATDRGAVVGHRGYGLFFQAHAEQWEASQALLQGFYSSFRPVGA